MKSYIGTYSAPGILHREATVLVFDKSIHIGYRNDEGRTLTEEWSMTDVEATYRLGEQGTHLKNSKLGRGDILIPGKSVYEEINRIQQELRKPWHKKTRAREWGRNSLILLITLAALVAIYFLIVPWLSEKMAARVSVSTEEQFGEAVYSGMQLEGVENKEASYAANQFFAELNIPTAYRIRISVVKGSIVNAFALPGGRIVIYDALLKEIEDYSELAALLSHEFIHVNNKHSTKAIFRKLGSRIFLALLLGKIGAVSSILVDQADNLKSLNYSRKLEKEADLDGVALLMERKIDPRGFSELFGHLKRSAQGNNIPELLASHPDTERRIDYITEESRGATIENNEQLKTIFNKIKQTLQQ